MGVFGKDVLAAFGYLPEYPTCSKAVGWYGIQCCVYFAGPSSHPSRTVPRRVMGLYFLAIGLGALQGCTLLPGAMVELGPIAPKLCDLSRRSPLRYTSIQ